MQRFGFRGRRSGSASTRSSGSSLAPAIIGTAFFSVMILLHAVRLRIPKVVIGRMLLNSGSTCSPARCRCSGTFDAGYKANLRNMALLERHARPGVPPTRSDYVFVGVVIGCFSRVIAIVADPAA